METNTPISSDEHFAEFLAREVATGRYGSASEVVRAGLRPPEDQATRTDALRRALTFGEASGDPAPFDFDAFVEAKKA